MGLIHDNLKLHRATAIYPLALDAIVIAEITSSLKSSRQKNRWLTTGAYSVHFLENGSIHLSSKLHCLPITATKRTVFVATLPSFTPLPCVKSAWNAVAKLTYSKEVQTWKHLRQLNISQISIRTNLKHNPNKAPINATAMLHICLLDDQLVIHNTCPNKRATSQIYAWLVDWFFTSPYLDNRSTVKTCTRHTR